MNNLLKQLAAALNHGENVFDSVMTRFKERIDPPNSFIVPYDYGDETFEQLLGRAQHGRSVSIDNPSFEPIPPVERLVEEMKRRRSSSTPDPYFEPIPPLESYR